MRIFSDPKEVQQAALEARAEGRVLGLVPTMGALHEGHLTLMREARPRVDVLAVSVFVNPKQFGPDEDLAAYPRDIEGDRRKCASAGVDWIFHPTPEQMYPEGCRTYVEVEDWGRKLCGASRPEHFRGVTTVVLKFFNLVQPNAAFFGWKDAQQFLILRKMVEDLNLPVEMVGVETVRETDGLAMSSRNVYLTERERGEAPVLYRALVAARERAYQDPGVTASELRRLIADTVASESTAKIDYIEIVSMNRLEPVDRVGPGTLIALAARFGKARLIDNVRIEPFRQAQDK